MLGNYLHLFYSDYGEDPMSLVNQTKGDIYNKFFAKAAESQENEKLLEDVLNIDIGDVVTFNEDAQTNLKYVEDINTVLANLKEASKKFDENSNYISYINNNILPIFNKAIETAKSQGGFTNAALKQMQKSRDQLEELTTRIKASNVLGKIASKKTGEITTKIIDSLNGTCNGIKGALGEIAHTLAFAQAIYKGNTLVESINIGAGFGISGITKLRKDPRIRADANKMHAALKSMKQQPKEDVHLFIDVGDSSGTVRADIQHVGISSKTTKNLNKVTVQNTTLKAMLEKAYPGSNMFLYHLAASLASDSRSGAEKGKELKIFPTIKTSAFSNNELTAAWEETCINAYKLNLADYIAGNGLTGNNVNYLIVGNRVISVSSIMERLMMGDDISSLQNSKKYIDSRGKYVGQHKAAIQYERENKEVRSSTTIANINKTWSAAKIQITLNLMHFI